jgi:terminal uridylyltransferase
MVLHYLVNIAQPFICPNLQQLARQPPLNPSPLEIENTLMCRGHNIQFWRNEQEIIAFARANQLNHNSESIGHLLRGFFEYFAQSGPMSSGRGKGFDWGRDVLSLRSPGGLLSKQTKGWTGAKTVLEVQGGGSNNASSPIDHPIQQQIPQQAAAADTGSPAKVPQQAGKADNFKEVRHRYLFAIEDPFELDHNVARTVTHNGIVSIRDEFRRAWRIIRSTGNANSTEVLLQDASKEVDTHGPFMQLLDDIHGVRTGSYIRS